MNDLFASQIPPEFLETKEYRRFVEFCDACRRYRYIGLCYGPSGVGKTRSARTYTRWDWLAPILKGRWFGSQASVPPEVAACRTLFYTPEVAISPRQLERDVQQLMEKLKAAFEMAWQPGQSLTIESLQQFQRQADCVELLVVDETERLKFAALEELRHLYDQRGFGLVLMGMPGIEKSLARYPQFYSRVGFLHAFRPLGAEDMRAVLAHKWRQLGLASEPGTELDPAVEAAILRITRGNFRLMERLLAQIERVLEINAMQVVTPAVVEAARESLVIGSL